MWPRLIPISLFWLSIWLASPIGLASLSAQPPVPPRPPTTSAEAIAFAVADTGRLSPLVQPFARYLWLPPGLDKQLLYKVVSGHVNSLSREAIIVPPVAILVDGSEKRWPDIAVADWPLIVMLRVLTTDYRWDRRVWDTLGEQDPYFHIVIREEPVVEEQTYQGNQWYRLKGSGTDWSKVKPAAKAKETLAFAPWLLEGKDALANLQTLVVRTASRTPVLRADNFLWQTLLQANRKVGYDGLLGIKNQRDFEALAGYDPNAKIDPSYINPVRAAVMISGVTRAERRVSFFQRTGAGTYSLTDDNDVATGRQNPLRFLDGGFQAKARETYANLPNRLLFVGLFVGNLPGPGQKEGDSVDSAPDFVGFDKLSHNNDGRIHKPLSCIRCHVNGGFQTVPDYFRTLANIGQPLQTVEPKQLKVLRTYQLPLEPILEDGRRVYSQALLQANGMTPPEYAKAVSKVYADYDDALPWSRAAEELGTDLPQLVRELDAFYRAQPIFKDTVFAMALALKEKQLPISRDQFHDGYNQLQLHRRGIGAWPEGLKRQVILLAEIKESK